MDKGARMGLAVLLGLSALAVQNSKAGSAVAWDGHGHLVTYHGYPVEEAKRLALETARSRYGNNVRLIGYTDTFGFGAIAVGGNRTGSVIAVALGKRSKAEAETLAIEHCLQAGGIEPRVRWRFKG